jgi:hypothetical protein
MLRWVSVLHWGFLGRSEVLSYVSESPKLETFGGRCVESNVSYSLTRRFPGGRDRRRVRIGQRAYKRKQATLSHTRRDSSSRTGGLKY